MWMIFGFLAVLLPLIAVFMHGRWQGRNAFLFSAGSFACCAGTLLDEIFTIYRRSCSGDWGGIEDTIWAVLLISSAVVIATLVLNLWSLALYYARGKGE